MPSETMATDVGNILDQKCPDTALLDDVNLPSQVDTVKWLRDAEDDIALVKDACIRLEDVLTQNNVYESLGARPVGEILGQQSYEVKNALIIRGRKTIGASTTARCSSRGTSAVAPSAALRA